MTKILLWHKVRVRVRALVLLDRRLEVFHLVPNIFCEERVDEMQNKQDEEDGDP